MAYVQILVVEDDPLVAEGIENILKHWGYAISGVVSSGESAITKVAETYPDLVLMDIQLRGDIDGIEAAKQIRARFDIPIVYLTAYEEESMLQQAKITEPFGYIIKPFESWELHTTVEIALYKHQMERKLRENEKKFRALNDAALDAIIMMDSDGNISFWNTAAEKMFGYSRQEALGKDLHDFLAPQRYHDAYKKALSQYKLTGQGAAVGKTLELSAVKKDGTEFPIELSLSAIKLKEEWNAIGIVRDITKHKRIENQLRKLNQQLQEASRHKSDFLASMSHELRTPLNAMIGYTSLTLNALKDSLPPEHLQNLIRAEQSARILLQLINDVLDFSKIEAGKMETFIEEIELNDLLEEAMITAEGLIAEKQVKLKQDFSSNLPIIESDYTRLKQILDNLVGNAIKFTTEGSITVRAIPMKDENIVRVEVEDTGCGIQFDVLESIFELFRQVDGSISKKFSGTGLGLAITKRLSDMLDITIGVQSEVGKGTLFWLNVPITFPLPESQAVEIMREADSQSSLSSETTSTPETSPTLPPICSPCEQEQEETKAAIKALVLCFCGQEMCSTLKRHLMGLPLEVEQVATVAECIEKAKRSPVWTIVLESDENGFEALTQLKNEPSVYHIPIILSSAEIAQHGFHVGPVEYLEKPIEDKKVFDALLRVTKVKKGDILVIDDDMIIRKVYSRMLSKAGYTPYVAGSGIEALEVLSKHAAFQAIILDLMMPDMDGFQILERIQQDQTWRRIPVVVVTAKTLSQAERSLLHNGTQLLLEKGKFSVETLSQQVESVTQSVTLAGTRSILVVDDNEMNLNLVAGVFESAGYTVYTSQSAHEGIEVAQKVLPDTILMDLAMPDMDGFEATQILKQHPETSDITVIVCSAFTTHEYKDKASQVGCEGYITKPIEPNRLVEQVTRLVLTSKITKKLAQQNITNNDYS